jgi:hypothetical protein
MLQPRGKSRRRVQIPVGKQWKFAMHCCGQPVDQEWNICGQAAVHRQIEAVKPMVNLNP